MAVLFVHGFSGSTKGSWLNFSRLLQSDPRLGSWDIGDFHYKSSWRPSWLGWWIDDPGLEKLSRSLRTFLTLPPWSDYKAIAVVAHSMGGLIAQRAILDDGRNTVSHLFLFGTPSRGIEKARYLARSKRQVSDMLPDSNFISELRSGWSKTFASRTPFDFFAVAGDMDAFVPEDSSILPFADDVRAIIAGDHSTMVKAGDAQDACVKVVVRGLLGEHRAVSAIDSGRLAVERRRFRDAVDAMLPEIENLDDGALCSLALALDSLGDGPGALQILDDYHNGGKTTSTEALGVLGGRIKRRWLLHRDAADLVRARTLYGEGLARAVASHDLEQAHYHAINVAFLDFLSAPANSDFAGSVEMAALAVTYAQQCRDSYWSIATEGEALLIMGKLADAREKYLQAVKMLPSPRDTVAMYTQAVAVADKAFGERGVRTMQQIFSRAG